MSALILREKYINTIAKTARNAKLGQMQDYLAITCAKMRVNIQLRMLQHPRRWCLL